jgi:hypothetical protein
MHEALLKTLQARFEANWARHNAFKWADVQRRLESNERGLWALNEMETTGGEPDVVMFGPFDDEYTFVDCSAQSPTGRRSLCYDRAALDARKENKPKDSAVDMAARWGAELLTEKQYRILQSHGDFDTKTSSWVQTPIVVRQLGGALFGDRRYGTVFIYHNGADAYYAARGFRCVVRI